jgi:glycine oxidase
MPSRRSADLSRLEAAVVGAGLIGLASARALLARGARVTVYDKGLPGAGASRAAAGMLAAAAESLEGADVEGVTLGQESLALWPAFAADVARESGRDIGFRQDGAIMAALDAREAQRLEVWAEKAAQLDLTLEPLDGAAARAREPGLSPEVGFAVFAPEDWSVDNRALAAALAASVEKAKGVIEERAAAVDVEPGKRPRLRIERPIGLEERAFDAVVIASGWSARDLAVRFPELGRVYPVKGQMLSVAAGDAAPRCVIRGRNAYLVPRAGGLTLIGATSEPNVSTAAVEPPVVHRLHRAAAKLIPALADAPIVETWSGIRPGLRARRTGGAGPLIATLAPGVIAAVGHHRNGVLLTPITGERVAALAARLTER